MTPTAKTVLYVRVSTAEQHSSHQITQARKEGFTFEDRHVIIDHGVSGVSTALKDRDQGKRLFDLLQPGDTLLVRWVNRIGRDYRDVKNTIETFLNQGVTVKTVINNMVFKPDHELAHDPMQIAARDAVLAFMVGIAEADATAAREARRAGIDHAKASADADTKYRGKKPSYTRATMEAVQAALSAPSPNVSTIARETGLTRQTVLRIKADPVAAEASLARWGM
ncbi:recombinase family protein [Pseudotabrizicola alkalilacus]|uniref:Recombinase family protein n=1 Tax=Pseudotabrizicola alkalilacus TaxID=2305252 RepID=A0A411Z1J2_9RHOB|nr:recombinase family protein [Pseudotabrizicola alkalilacus]RGP36936.1 recombinase family protein [Pseudotabrizicola alkalilacus]